MWQRSVAVLLAVMMVAVRDGTMGGATVPQGPRSEWQSIRQVDSADTSVASVADRPWAIGKLCTCIAHPSCFYKTGEG